jgi:hypothetical protein
MAVASLLASCGFAMADTTEIQVPKLTLDPKVITADAAPSEGLLMQALGKAGGADKTLSDLGITASGFIEGGYTVNHRQPTWSNVNGPRIIIPGPFNHEIGNHFMLNQLDFQISKTVDPSKGKFDVGGEIEFLYGTDAARIHSTGLGYNGSDPTDNNSPSDPRAVANVDPQYQFDIPQAFIDIGLPVGNGLTLRAGKFVTLLSYETIDPRNNPFYSHSYLFSAVPGTQTGILAIYPLNDQWKITAGLTRGWDIALEESQDASGRESCYPDLLGQIAYTPNKQLNVMFNFTSGPENAGDTSHYRTALDPVIIYKATDKLTLGLEGLYVYDGGRNSAHLSDPTSNVTHGYGDVWGAVAYAGYALNDYLTLNARAEKAHSYLNSPFFFDPAVAADAPFTPHGINAYEVTLGVTIKPMPKDPIGQNLSIRPEVRYDFTDSEDHKFYQAGNNTFKDQLTFGADFIFTF